MPDTYKIKRNFEARDLPAVTIRVWLTEEEAQEWCNDPRTSSSTCDDTPEGPLLAHKLPDGCGRWFDSYTLDLDELPKQRVQSILGERNRRDFELLEMAHRVDDLLAGREP